jgi:hypothetical protein
VKTLQDRPRLLPVKRTTIAYLVSRPAPSYLPSTRLPFERHIFRVTAAVTLVRSEDDQDFHVVLSDGRRTMIAETPAPSCTSRATPTRRRQMAQARAAVRLCAKAVVTGVAFFDFKHGQTGLASNGIELHPVLAFRCLSREGLNVTSQKVREERDVGMTLITTKMASPSRSALGATPTSTTSTRSRRG